MTARPAGTCRLSISDWPQDSAIVEKPKVGTTIDQFSKGYPVKVTYIEDVIDNDQFFVHANASIAFLDVLQLSHNVPVAFVNSG